MVDEVRDDTPGGRRCATCLYGWGATEEGGQLLVRLECRRYPPQAGTSSASYWFPVSPLGWCGEWCEHPAQQGGSGAPA